MRRRIIQLVDQKTEKGELDLEANAIARKTTVLDVIHFLANAWKNSVTEETEEVSNLRTKRMMVIFQRNHYLPPAISTLTWTNG